MATGYQIANLPEAHFSGGSNLAEDDGRGLSLAEILRNGHKAPSYDNTTRPDAAVAGAGAVIYNSDDLTLNVSDGSDWRDMSGNLT